ncbi:MAG TPA: ComF family protein [Caldithrix abyssi]|uniref:ComF family protein n=1 Tax=Caldithrix abyssi TaxID=187145 RepID=A0A7V1LJN4_CALAY|nr:ComF family protein [Caldithrix abyssi]
MKKNTLLWNIIDFIFPNYCLVCETQVERDKKYVCNTCFSEILNFDEKYRPVLLKRINHPAFDDIFIRYQFGPVFRILIHHLKYQQCLQIAEYLGRALSTIITGTYDNIVPVPLHKAKLKERGFNQSTLIAREVSKATAIPLSEKILMRRRYTKTQTHLNREQRLTNVARAFTLHEKVEGKRILLIDDVITTGATLNTCAGLLKAHGAGVVDIAAVATPTTLLQEQLEREVSGNLVSLQKSG